MPTVYLLSGSVGDSIGRDWTPYPVPREVPTGVSSMQNKQASFHYARAAAIAESDEYYECYEC